MRRLEVVNKAFTFTNDNPPQYKNLSFQVQVIRDQFNVVRAEFYIEGQELQNFLDNGMDYDQLAEEKMKWILETNTTPVDSFVLESIQREQDRVGIAVEENKALAIEQATEAAMQIASEKVESVRADIETSDQKKDLEIITLQQMIVELTLMLSMIGQPELPTEPDPDPPVDPEPPIEEPPSEIPEEPPVEDPPSDPAPTEPIPEEPTNEEFNPDVPTENSDPIGGEGGE